MNKYFQIAKDVSLKSPSKFKLGCVITDMKGRIISTGFNNMTVTHPKCRTFDNFIHAELDAVLCLKSKIKKGKAFIYRETKDGTVANSRPCPVCYQALKAIGIKVMHYTTNQGFASEVLL